MDENKKRALSAALGQIEKQFGKGSVMRMGDRPVEAAEVIGTRDGWSRSTGRSPPARPP
jgi:recombination protein RecA